MIMPTMLMTFDEAGGEPAWVAVNDDVMGGVSRGAAQFVEGHLRFSGMLSLENNGGFASVRADARAFDLRDAEALVLRVQGDGRTYQVRLTTDARVGRSAVTYRAEFPTTAGEWREVRVPLAALVPTYRGSRLDGPPFDPARVEEIRLYAGDGQAGAFALLVDWIARD